MSTEMIRGEKRAGGVTCTVVRGNKLKNASIDAEKPTFGPGPSNALKLDEEKGTKREGIAMTPQRRGRTT